MTNSAPTIDLSAAVHGAAAALAAAFGLGSEIIPTDEWPVEEGDTVLTVALSGTADGVLHLALNDDVARRLTEAPDVLQQGVRGAIAALCAAFGDGAEFLAGDIGMVSIGVPDAIAGVAEQGSLTALVGLSLQQEAVAPEAPAMPQAAPAAPVAPAPLAPAPVAAPASTDPSSFFQPEQLGQTGSRGAMGRPLSVLHDVDLVVTAELGRATMPVRELLELSPGMVVEIDRAAGAPIDLLVNGRRIATGEVVVIDEEFGVRITEILAGDAL
jgi:flagellar motor switch protein FliN/FliY